MNQLFLLSCRRLIIIIFLGGAFVGVSAGTWAEAPMQKTQAPGFYRIMVGQIEVTALFDGIYEFDTGLLKNISEAEAQGYLKRAKVENPHKYNISINAYLINIGSKLVMIDAGSGNIYGPKIGMVMDNLKASGYAADQVDAVLITHLHPDHACGLADADSKPIFPKAVVYVAKTENDYWLSAEEPKNVPPEHQEHLKQARKMVQDLSKPYIASGRWKTFENGEQAILGVKAISMPGHTPGHTAYEITSQGQSLIIIGDTIHCTAVQFAKPGVAVDFDVDSKQAVATRKVLFRRVADGKTLVAGMHLAFPGIGRIRSDGNDGYFWVPVEYSTMPDAK